VDGSENARQKFLGKRIGFKFHELAVEPVQILITLDQEFLDQFVHCTTLFSIRTLPGKQGTARRCPALRSVAGYLEARDVFFRTGCQSTPSHSRHMRLIVKSVHSL
jgi:hypothetical protein